MSESGSRRIVQVGVTRAQTDKWVAQQLREATPFGIAPKYLIRDNNTKKYGPHFEAVVVGTGIAVLRTPIRAPRAKEWDSYCTSIGRLRRTLPAVVFALQPARKGRLWRIVEPVPLVAAPFGA